MRVPGALLRKRILVLFLGFVAAFAVLVLRVGYLQLVRGSELRAQAFEMRLWNMPVEPRRGDITDRTGHPLAVSVDVESVYVVPAEVRDPESTARQLSQVLSMPYEEVYRRITRPVSFWWVRRKVPDEVARRVRQLGLPGIYLTQESQRVYPQGSLAAHVLGFVGLDNQGLGGVELTYDGELRGVPGAIRAEFDARGRPIPYARQMYVPAQPGHTLVLTLDATIQYILERELDRAMRAHSARSGIIIALDPRTGEVLGMAVRPTYDPNRYQDFPAELYQRNPAIADSFPPGSVFKPITAAAALDSGKVTPATPFWDPGYLQVPGHVIRNWDRRGLGATTFAEGFEKSANTVFAAVALRVGAEEFYRYLEAFGLTARTGIDLPGEGTGIVPDRERLRPVDLAVMGFGQTLTVTPIGLTVAIAALANDGMLMRPHVVREIRTRDGTLVRAVQPQPVRRVVKPETARTLLQLMAQVVERGTGVRAQVEGYRVGGKTGTAQKVERGRIVPGKYIASFVGVAPLDHPRVVVYVAIDEPQGIYYGGWVAAPVFAAVVRDILHYLDVPPSPPGPKGPGAPEPPGPTAVPQVVNLPLDEAEAVLRYAGLKVRVEGGGKVVRSQVPAAGVRVLPGTTVVLRTEGEVPPEEALTPVTVPDLKGKTRAEAAQKLAELGLRLDASGSGRAVAQLPLPGTRVPAGTYVTVYFREGPASVPESGP